MLFSLFARGTDATSAELENLAQVSANPDEIQIGDSGDESEGEQGESAVVEEVSLALEREVIPSAVFGSISEEKQGEVLGAKERFLKKK